MDPFVQGSFSRIFSVSHHNLVGMQKEAGIEKGAGDMRTAKAQLREGTLEVRLCSPSGANLGVATIRVAGMCTSLPSLMLGPPVSTVAARRAAYLC